MMRVNDVESLPFQQSAQQRCQRRIDADQLAESGAWTGLPV
jgi:hypothetical protein